MEAGLCSMRGNRMTILSGLQDSPNTQTGTYMEVRVPWPANPDYTAQLQLLLASHPGRSLAVTVALPRRPNLGWLDGPDTLAFSLASPVSWRCADLRCHLLSFFPSERASAMFM